MNKFICPLCNKDIKTGQVRKEWWMSDIDKRIAHEGCITAYEKGVVKGKSVVNEDLEFAYKRAKVLADILGIPVNESPEVTGTIIGMVRRKVELLQDQLSTSEQRVARECCEIVDDTVSDHRWGNDGSCGVNTKIKEAIKAKYGL